MQMFKRASLIVKTVNRTNNNKEKGLSFDNPFSFVLSLSKLVQICSAH